MATPAPLPPKQNIPKELFDSATTLSKEAQAAAVKKAKELGYDLTAGRIPMHETLLNLTYARDVLLDIVENGKLVQLPLKIQYTLLTQTQRVSQHLVSLGAGTDAIVALEDAVDDLTCSIWQYNLLNLSGEVLGFSRKMNELKAQETQLRELRDEADVFANLHSELRERRTELETTQKSAAEAYSAIAQFSDQARALVGEIASTQSQVAADTSAIQNSQAAISASRLEIETAQEKIASVATEIDNTQSEIETHRNSIASLRAQFDEALKNHKQTSEALQSQLRVDVEQLMKELREDIAVLRNECDEKVRLEATGLDNSTREMREDISTLVQETDTRLKRVETDQIAIIDKSAQEFEKSSSEKLEAVIAELTEQVAQVKAAANASVTENDREVKRLTSELEELEGRIRKSIERATGYTLFHSFQERQFQLGKAKRFWAWCLAGAVAASLAASAWFILSLPYVKVYDAAFYIKLSISLPIIYAIAFCALQYSRERRLEEEYAFKSNISISLDPYQRLVKTLVDEEKPEEASKYTAFVIESINRVFTSPTEPVFGPHAKSSNGSVDKALKQVRDLLEPLIAAATKR